MRILFILLILLSTTNQYCDAQIRKVYGKDFNYKTLYPKDTFPVSSSMPPYYVCCTYVDNKLSDINLFIKEDWMKDHKIIHASIIPQNDKILFVYDAGVMRTGGYGRLFPKKTKFTDTAMLIRDTLIFKNANKYGYELHLVTDLFSDSSIITHNKTFDRKEHENQSLKSNINNFRNWFSDTTYLRYYKNIIFLNSDRIVNHIKIKDEYADYTFYDRYLRDDFLKKRMPISFFWIKHSGMIY